MKTYFNLFTLVLLLACSACQRDKSKAFLQGTFTSSATGELSTADDTLIIEPAENNNVLLHRRTGYNLIRNGQLGKRQYEREEWNAIYDASTQTLMETRKGKLITLYPDSGYLQIGKRKYTKK